MTVESVNPVLALDIEAQQALGQVELARRDHLSEVLRTHLGPTVLEGLRGTALRLAIEEHVHGTMAGTLDSVREILSTQADGDVESADQRF